MAARRRFCCSPAMSKSAPSPPRSPATWPPLTTCGSCFRKPAFAPRVPLLWRMHRPVVAAAPRRQKSMPAAWPTLWRRIWESRVADVRPLREQRRRRDHSGRAKGSEPRRRHLRAGGDADIRLGIVLLSPGGSGEADRFRHRLVAVLGGGRAVARAVDRRSGFSLGRPRHCAPWRSSGPGRERRPFGGRPIRSGAGALSACFSDRLVADWTRHGRGSLRSGLCDSRTPVRARRTLGNHDAHAVWRFREHRLLASFRIPRCPSWVARRMSGLRRLPARRCIAGLSVRPAARISAARASASVAEFAAHAPATPEFPGKQCFSCWPRPSR